MDVYRWYFSAEVVTGSTTKVIGETGVEGQMDFSREVETRECNFLYTLMWILKNLISYSKWLLKPRRTLDFLSPLIHKSDLLFNLMIFNLILVLLIFLINHMYKSSLQLMMARKMHQSIPLLGLVIDQLFHYLFLHLLYHHFK